jgi:hypothetical protein
MLRDALGTIQGVQVSAPFGKVPLALKVFEVLPGWAPAEEREAAAAACKSQAKKKSVTQ